MRKMSSSITKNTRTLVSYVNFAIILVKKEITDYEENMADEELNNPPDSDEE